MTSPKEKKSDDSSQALQVLNMFDVINNQITRVQVSSFFFQKIPIIRTQCSIQNHIHRNTKKRMN